MKINQLNVEEKVISYCIQSTWILYFTGLLYVAGSLIAWLLVFIFFKRFMDGKNIKMHFLAYVWIFAMSIQLLAIIIGHINHDLPTTSLVKSTIGWAKGWALFALFPLVAHLNIRVQTIQHSLLNLSKQTLWIAPILIAAAIFHLPGSLYSSPLKFLANPSFFEIELYGLNASTGLPRWRLFTPWGPALGLYGNILFVFCCIGKRDISTYLGFAAAILMVLLSQSRMGILCLLVIPCLSFFLIKFKDIKYLIALAILTPVMTAIIPIGIEYTQMMIEQVHTARADSSRVRGALERIAIERWQTEAPIWGHGVVEKGSHYVEYMPIGSHHTWLGLLFVKGLVGLFAMAIPMLATIFWLMYRYFSVDIQHTHFKYYRAALHLMLVLCAYSFTENLEILAYLYWPALLFIGLTFKLKPPIHFN